MNRIKDQRRILDQDRPPYLAESVMDNGGKTQ
jgi:hypothetical protein